MAKLKKCGRIVVGVVLLSLLGASAALASTSPFDGQQAALLVGGKELVCYNQWTGRWIMTYLRTSEGHWVTKCQLYVPDFITNEQDAQNWSWSEEYIADQCSLDDEPQTWQGTYISTQKEYIRKCQFTSPVIIPNGVNGFN